MLFLWDKDHESDPRCHPWFHLYEWCHLVTGHYICLIMGAHFNFTAENMLPTTVFPIKVSIETNLGKLILNVISGHLEAPRGYPEALCGYPKAPMGYKEDQNG